MSTLSEPKIVVRDRVRPPKNWVKQARKLHLYLGTFFAPAILFFSLTGALQTFSFHESQPGSTYQPPRWLQVMAQVHKKQTTVMPVRRPQGPPRQPAAVQPPRSMPVATLLTKWFVFLMGIGLTITTALGIYMAFKLNPRSRMVWALLIAGIVVPLAFVLA